MEIRCSGLSRVMTCAGSIGFTLPRRPSGAAAEEGTAAGRYLQHLVEGTDIPTHAENGVMFDADMKFFTGRVFEKMKGRANGPILCENRVDWQTRSGIWIRGQYDQSYVGGPNLHIDDLKYGWGIVEAKSNWQLLGYAIGEVIRRGQAFENIILTIHQPRPHHEDGDTREWVLTYSELLAYKEQIEVRMEQIAAGDRTLITSEKCRYCPAAEDACPALNKAFYRGIEVAHEFMQDSINDQELSFQLDLVNRVSEVLKIKKDSLETLAVDRMKNGKLIPNYITEASYGDRKWKPGISPVIIETLTGKSVVKEEMLSPAQAEKLGISKDFINQLVDRHFKGQKLKRKDTAALGEQIFGGK